MNKTMIRIISALLVLLMAVACFAACNDPVDPNEGEDTQGGAVADGTGGDQSGDTEAPEQSIEDILGFEIPQLNTQFNILHQTQTSVVTDIIADSFDGDEVSVEIYERNLAIEEDFATQMNYVGSFGSWNTRGDDKKFLESAVQAGTNDYDMVVGSSVSMATMMYSGLFHNLCDLESIDFDHSWWMKNTVETYGVGDHVYGAMGDITHSFYSNLGLIALNVTLAENYGVEAAHGDLYQMVYDGKWTLDKMLEIGSAYGEDNGDGVMTLGDDVFGCISITVPSRLFLFSLGHELITLNDTEDGVDIPNALDEKTINSYEKLYAAFPQSGMGSSPNFASSESSGDVCTFFAADKVLMFTSYFSYLGTESVRNMVSEYMIMPMPKYDETQDDYITPFATGASMVLIPVTAVDEETSAMVMEYMGYLGERDITPVYIEQTLKLKYASDPQVMEMVQYIIDRSAFTLTQALIWNCDAGANFRNMYCFGSLNCVGSPNIASFYTTYRRVWQKQLDNICEELQ